eukprot:986830-Prorocentrum_minimum.AAC.1
MRTLQAAARGEAGADGDATPAPARELTEEEQHVDDVSIPLYTFVYLVSGPGGGRVGVSNGRISRAFGYLYTFDYLYIFGYLYARVRVGCSLRVG